MSGHRSPKPAARPSTIAGLALCALLSVFVALPIHARVGSLTSGKAGSGLVAALGLSDLALFTEARYTRHPAMADLHSAFQDHPAAFEHFPSGALTPPPPHFNSGTLQATTEGEKR